MTRTDHTDLQGVANSPDVCYACSQIESKLQVAIPQVERDEVTLPIGGLAIIEDHPIWRSGEELYFYHGRGWHHEGGKLKVGIACELWQTVSTL